MRLVKNIIARVSYRQLKTLIFLLKSGVSLRYVYSEMARFFRNLTQDFTSWEPSSEVEIPGIRFEESQYDSVAYFIHLFHEEYLVNIEQFLLEGPRIDFYITTPKPKLLEQLHVLKTQHLNLREIRLSENRGRNIGPFLVEFSGTALKYKYMIHLHSKRSNHMTVKAGKKWAEESWNFFRPKSMTLESALKIMSSQNLFSTCFTIDLQVTPPSSFTWGQNRQFALSRFPGWNLPEQNERFSFPAGGMFMASSADMSKVLSAKWTYEDFPEEKGQLDGTLQHAIERLFGLAGTAENTENLIFHVNSSSFTKDKSFLNYSNRIF